MKIHLQHTIVFVMFVCLLLFWYNIHSNSSDVKSNNAHPSPLPRANLDDQQIVEVFDTIATYEGGKAVTVNINYNGKYKLFGESFAFDYYVKNESFDVAKRVKAVMKGSENKHAQKWTRYLKVHIYGEELSKQMRIFFGMVNFPGLENFKLVAPHFKGRSAVSNGPDTFESIYNIHDLNKAFVRNNLPPVVLDDEYDKSCENEKEIYVLIVIDQNAGPRLFGYTKSIADRLYSKNSKGWIDCSENKKILERFSVNLEQRKMICITGKFNVSTIRNTLLKNAKCIEIGYYGDHGLSKLRKSGGLSPDELFLYALNPSDIILKEVDKFTKMFLQRPYVAIHMRTGHIRALPSTVNRCFQLAMKIVDALKKKRDVKSTYLSTDMTKYGSGGAADPGHEEYLAQISGAVLYSPKATGKVDAISPSSISITNVMLMRKSDFLIAIGAGGFHSFVLSQFIREHFEKDPKIWSAIRMCENARNREKLKKDVDYSKYLKD
ncbi:uncharacterized protein LOC124453418 [Xenia sp. Carnegie-2017]|uniref:uncharacterized protein LOC124453418 n=1 Tax=Xenia sp. Carnegie-2017 TaxID=2897299 RepID=UPI001F03901E|nr:uncharacterized protein LOC124453418 [Xenia sp. Carnegie-2017]